MKHLISLAIIFASQLSAFAAKDLASNSDFFDKIRNERVSSDPNVVWKNFGPGMSGYNEEFWCHPTDTNVMFMGPDMHVSYGTWDNGKTWSTLKDWDGDGQDLERVNDIVFSSKNPDFGMAIDRDGLVSISNDRGRSWEVIYEIPHAAVNQWTNAHSRLDLNPNDDNVWYIGTGGFWDVKSTHRKKSNPAGIGNTTYAHGYILKSTDKGKTWNKIATDIDDQLNVGRIVVDPRNSQHIVIATGQGMYKSTNGGTSWSESNTGLPNNLPKDLTSYYDASSGEYILYTMEQSVYEIEGNTIKTTGGIFKSTNGGDSWTDITGNMGLDFTVITDNMFRDKYANAVAFWLGKSKNEINALDYPSHTLQVFRRIAVNPLNKEEIYIQLNQRHDKNFGPGEVWKTEDGGATWKIMTRFGSYWKNKTNSSYWSRFKGMTMDTNVEFAHVRYEMEDRHEALAGCRNFAINSIGQVFTGIAQQTHRSNDGGISWQQIDDDETGEGTNAWVGRGTSNLPGRFMLHNTGIPDYRLFCSGEHGLWKWAPLGDYPDKDATAVIQIEGQVHDINGNHGAHSVSTVAIHPNDPNTIFILAWRQEHRGWLRKSTDGGKTWNNIVQIFDADNAAHEEVASQYSLLIDPVNPENMYFTAIFKPISCGTNSGQGPDLTMGEYGAYRSVNGGTTWTPINSGFPAGASVNRLVMDPENPETLYACLNQWRNDDPYGLYKTTNKGDKWTKMTIPSVIRSVNNLFIDENTKDMFLSCGSRAGDDNAGGVYRSKDNGASWQLFFRAPYVWQVETSPINSNKIMVNVARKAGSNGDSFKSPGLFLTEDDGTTWKRINTGLANIDKMVDIELDPVNENILWCAGWGSGWYKAILPYDGVKAIVKDQEVEEAQNLTLYGMSSLGTQLEYEWIAPEGISLSSTDYYKTTFRAPWVEKDTEFTFKLVVSNAEAKDTTSFKVTVKNNPNAKLSNTEAKTLKIYPNPVKGNFISLLNVAENANYRIANLQGQILQQGLLSSNTVDISTLDQGLYFIGINQNNKTSVSKFLRL